MGKSIQRVGDANTAGGLITRGDPTVLVNGRPVAVIGARVTPHPCCGKKGCPPTHCAAVTTSKTARVLVNGKPVVLTGDLDTCGHARGVGSFDVIVGL